MDILKNHVTIRNFSDRSIEDELLNQILECGVRASTTGNMQWYSIIVTRDKVRKEKIIPLHFNQVAAKTAPVILTCCADINSFNKWCLLNDATPGFDNFVSFFNAATDALLVAQNISIAAENYGLGICYLGTTIYNAAEIIEVLELPKFVVPITALAIGWPVIVPPLTDRLPLKSVVHNEAYNNPVNDDIHDMYSFKENLDSSRNFVVENNKRSLAQVYTDVRYKKTDNVYFSEKFLNTIKSQGFDL